MRTSVRLFVLAMMKSGKRVIKVALNCFPLHFPVHFLNSSVHWPYFNSSIRAALSCYHYSKQLGASQFYDGITHSVFWKNGLKMPTRTKHLPNFVEMQFKRPKAKIQCKEEQIRTLHVCAWIILINGYCIFLSNKFIDIFLCLYCNTKLSISLTYMS